MRETLTVIDSAKEKKLKTQNRHLLNFLAVNHSPEVLKHVEYTNLSEKQQK
jgi:hypothetical protein